MVTRYSQAHSTGVYGKNGRGVVAHFGLEDEIFARLHTFGKALASNGGKITKETYTHEEAYSYLLIAVILGSSILREYLINYARPLIYSTFMSFSSLASIKCAYDMLASGETIPVSILMGGWYMDESTSYIYQPMLIRFKNMYIFSLDGSEKPFTCQWVPYFLQQVLFKGLSLMVWAGRCGRSFVVLSHARRFFI